jgi:hypothetical protein
MLYVSNKLNRLSDNAHQSSTFPSVLRNSQRKNDIIKGLLGVWLYEAVPAVIHRVAKLVSFLHIASVFK